MTEELKKALIEVGYNESEAERIALKKKVYFQENLDDIVETSKKNIENKIKDKFIPREEYEALNSNYNNLNKQVKANEIKQSYMKIGGKEGNEFDSFLKLNEDLYEIDNEQLEKRLSEKANQFDWAFHKNEERPSIHNEQSILQSLKDGDNGDLVEGTLYKKNNF